MKKIALIFSILFALFMFSTINATNYYICNHGVHSAANPNAPDYGQSQDNPFESLADFKDWQNSNTIPNNSTIYIANGGEYRDRILIKDVNGTPPNHITVTHYSCQTTGHSSSVIPKIWPVYDANQISWSHVSGEIYRSINIPSPDETGDYVACNFKPQVVWFKTSNGQYHRGRIQDTDVSKFTNGTLDSLYEFKSYGQTLGNFYVEIYGSVGAQGNYVEVLIPELQFALGINESNITIDGLDIAFATHAGIWVNNAVENSEIKNCVIHHIGMAFDDGGSRPTWGPPYRAGNEIGAGNGIIWFGDGTTNSIHDNNIYECGVHGIYISNYVNPDDQYTLDDLDVYNNNVYNNYHTGIDLMAGTGGVEDIRVYRNKVYDANRDIDYEYSPYFYKCRCVGIQTQSESETDDITNIKIYSNLVYNMSDHAINISYGSDYIYVYGNTAMSGNQHPTYGSAGLYLNDDGENHHMYVKNNILFADSARNWAIEFDNSTSYSNKTIDYNIYYNFNGNFGHYGANSGADYNSLDDWPPASGSNDDHSVATNPYFIDKDNYDFRPDVSCPDRSYAVNNGQNIGSPYYVDVDGYYRGTACWARIRNSN